VGQHRQLEQQQFAWGLATGAAQAAAQIKRHGDLQALGAVVGHRLAHHPGTAALGGITGQQQAGQLTGVPVALQQGVGSLQVAAPQVGAWVVAPQALERPGFSQGSRPLG
jgi:hypothetical protein